MQRRTTSTKDNIAYIILPDLPSELGVVDVHVYKAPPPTPLAKMGIPLPVMPAWAPTPREWENPDAVF